MRAARITADWIAADWGTTRLRVWAMGADGDPLARAEGPGMGALRPRDFEPALLAAAGDCLGEGRTPVVVCGMAGAREGWSPAPYADVAAPLATLADGPARPACDPRLSVAILPGLRQTDPPDVMRGEETQLAGLLAREPDFAGVALLPGSHAKWAEIAGGRVRRFRTFLTGELFAALAAHTVLRHGLAGNGWDAAAFAGGAAEALRDPLAVTARLFALRAAGLLGAADPVAARSRLSGLLIGQEIAAATDFAGPVTLIGASALCDAYADALALAGRAVARVDGEAAVLAGLRLAHARLFGDARCAP